MLLSYLQLQPFVSATQILEGWYEMMKLQLTLLLTIVTIVSLTLVLVMSFDSLSNTYKDRHETLDYAIAGVFVVANIILRVMIGFNVWWFLSICGLFTSALLIRVLVGKILNH